MRNRKRGSTISIYLSITDLIKLNEIIKKYKFRGKSEAIRYLITQEYKNLKCKYTNYTN